MNTPVKQDLSELLTKSLIVLIVSFTRYPCAEVDQRTVHLPVESKSSDCSERPSPGPLVLWGREDGDFDLSKVADG